MWMAVLGTFLETGFVWEEGKTQEVWSLSRGFPQVTSVTEIWAVTKRLAQCFTPTRLCVSWMSKWVHTFPLHWSLRTHLGPAPLVQATFRLAGVWRLLCDNPRPPPPFLAQSSIYRYTHLGVRFKRFLSRAELTEEGWLVTTFRKNPRPTSIEGTGVRFKYREVAFLETNLPAPEHKRN